MVPEPSTTRSPPALPLTGLVVETACAESYIVRPGYDEQKPPQGLWVEG